MKKTREKLWNLMSDNVCLFCKNQLEYDTLQRLHIKWIAIWNAKYLITLLKAKHWNVNAIVCINRINFNAEKKNTFHSLCMHEYHLHILNTENVSLHCIPLMQHNRWQICCEMCVCVCIHLINEHVHHFGIFVNSGGKWNLFQVNAKGIKFKESITLIAYIYLMPFAYNLSYFMCMWVNKQEKWFCESQSRCVWVFLFFANIKCEFYFACSDSIHLANKIFKMTNSQLFSLLFFVVMLTFFFVIARENLNLTRNGLPSAS